jgi:hypothetical protein
MILRPRVGRSVDGEAFGAITPGVGSRQEARPVKARRGRIDGPRALEVSIRQGWTKKPAHRKKPVKVFLLLGRSIMLGTGEVGPGATRGTPDDPTKEEGRSPHPLKGFIKADP